MLRYVICSVNLKMTLYIAGTLEPCASIPTYTAKDVTSISDKLGVRTGLQCLVYKHFLQKSNKVKCKGFDVTLQYSNASTMLHHTKNKHLAAIYEDGSQPKLKLLLA